MGIGNNNDNIKSSNDGQDVHIHGISQNKPGYAAVTSKPMISVA